MCHLDYSCCRDKVNRAAGRPACRQAGAQVSWFLLFHIDSFIVTSGCSSTYRDWQKTRHRDPPAGGTPTQLNRRAVSTNISVRDDYALAPYLISFVLTNNYSNYTRICPSLNRQFALLLFSESYSYKINNSDFTRTCHRATVL